MTIIYENEQGDTLNINSGNNRIVSMEGVSPSSVINTSSISGYDGATYISSQMPMRNIVILLELMGDIETNRLKIYDIFHAKQKGTLYYQTEARNVKIECYTEKIPFSLTARSTEIQISLLCPQPYFESLEALQKSIAAEIGLFHFDFQFPEEFMISEKSASVMVEVENNSDVDVGMQVVFYATSAVKNPSLLNVKTGELIRMDFIMQAGDTITVNTKQGKKANIILLRNGEETNIINYMTLDFTFTQLHPGTNLFHYNAEENLDGLEVTIYYSEYYSGV